MSKNKKVNTSQLKKAEAAHQRNEFLQRLKQFCDKVSDPSVFPLIPPAHLEELYLFRNRPVKMEAADGQSISPNMLKEARGLLSLLKSGTMQLGVGSVDQMSFYDFMTIGMTLMMYAMRVKETDYKDAVMVKLKLSPLAGFAEGPGYAQAWSTIHATMNIMAIVHCDMASQLYVIKQESRNENKGTIGMYTCWDVYSLQSEKIQILIDGVNRPAFRVGMPYLEPLRMDEVKVEPALLNLRSETALPVYVQAHALNRLVERMDGVTKGFLHLHIYLSFKEPKVCRNKKGEWLFEFILLGKKVGYFKADVIDAKIILRTFLFLTNNGTPEGEALHEHTGIMKEDKIYLSIDKFSSFVHSDIKDNERIKAIFIHAGCESLFEIDSAVCVQQGGDQSLATLIENYLK